MAAARSFQFAATVQEGCQRSYRLGYQTAPPTRRLHLQTLFPRPSLLNHPDQCCCCPYAATLTLKIKIIKMGVLGFWGFGVNVAA